MKTALSSYRVFHAFGFLSLSFCLASPGLANANLCAELSASPYEPEIERGVQFGAIDAERAIPACRAALSDDPSDSATAYRLGRALGAAEAWEEALELARRAAEAGYTPAFSMLGFMHLNGQGAPQDDAAAVRWYRMAAEKGDMVGKHALGFLSDVGRGVEQDDAEAVRWYRMSADQGFPDAQAGLASMYEFGRGVPQDRAKAAELYREAVAQDDRDAPFANVRLASLLWNGDGVEQDRDEALRQFRRAAEAGDGEAQAELALRFMNGDGVERDDAEAYRFATQAAESGNGYGMYLLGFAFEHGRATNADIARAAHWYGESASTGHPAGETAFARMLEEGRGIAPDLPRARGLFQAAAESGNAEAMARLGRMLRTGDGGPRDLEAARGWLERAGAAPIAQHQLGLMTWLGQGNIAQDRAGGLALIRRAADAGLAEAQVEAARILTTATGGEPFRDEAAAIAYLERAAQQENMDALYLLGSRLYRGRGVTQNRERGMAMLERAATLGSASARLWITNARELEELQAEQCTRMIQLCNRGCLRQDDGSYIYNTRDGERWFHESGRLIPADEAPSYGCPQ